jgi:carbon monoxide dehydrogenase subunit G
VRLERDILIGRPVEEVFSFVSDPANLPSWQTAVVEVRRPEGEIAVGSRFGETRHFVGKRFKTTVEVVELERDRVFAIRVVDGPLPITIRHLFAPEEGATRVTIAGEAELRGAMRVAGGIMAKAAEHDAGASLARLKAVLEADGEAS